jgi:hypothetical protein
MHLNQVNAGHGWLWVKLGLRVFFKQPLAMAGLFFMFMMVISLLAAVPLLGTFLAVALVPAGTLGLMAASREANDGRFPMPLTLISAFRGGPDRTRAMLMLGALYAVALLLVMLVSGLFLPTETLQALQGDKVDPEQVRQTLIGPGLLVVALLYLPLLAAFWHAPPLVFWHGVTPGKALFFSLMACWKNKTALMVFGLGWLGIFLAAGLFTSVVAGLLGAQAVALITYPMVLLLAAMFHSSLYFTFRDSFVTHSA